MICCPFHFLPSKADYPNQHLSKFSHHFQNTLESPEHINQPDQLLPFFLFLFSTQYNLLDRILRSNHRQHTEAQELQKVMPTEL